MADASRTGGKMKTLRESLGLSTEELAERCDCDVAMIERLEAGELAPSLAPLIKITRALGVRLGTLLDDDTNVGPVVTRRDEAQDTTRMKGLSTMSDAGELDFFALAAGKSARHMEPFIVDVHPPQSSTHDLSSHEGEEFIYVLSGEIEIFYGKDVHRLAAGDSVYYDSIVPHHLHAANGTDAKILAVVYAPY
jgi:transcriptional regulator with XRE-family HTH domain